MGVIISPVIPLVLIFLRLTFGKVGIVEPTSFNSTCNFTGGANCTPIFTDEHLYNLTGFVDNSSNKTDEAGKKTSPSISLQDENLLLNFLYQNLMSNPKDINLITGWKRDNQTGNSKVAKDLTSTSKNTTSAPGDKVNDKLTPLNLNHDDEDYIISSAIKNKTFRSFATPKTSKNQMWLSKQNVTRNESTVDSKSFSINGKLEQLSFITTRGSLERLNNTSLPHTERTHLISENPILFSHLKNNNTKVRNIIDNPHASNKISDGLNKTFVISTEKPKKELSEKDRIIAHLLYEQPEALYFHTTTKKYKIFSPLLASADGQFNNTSSNSTGKYNSTVISTHEKLSGSNSTAGNVLTQSTVGNYLNLNNSNAMKNSNKTVLPRQNVLSKENHQSVRLFDKQISSGLESVKNISASTKEPKMNSNYTLAHGYKKTNQTSNYTNLTSVVPQTKATLAKEALILSPLIREFSVLMESPWKKNIKPKMGPSSRVTDEQLNYTISTSNSNAETTSSDVTVKLQTGRINRQHKIKNPTIEGPTVIEDDDTDKPINKAPHLEDEILMAARLPTANHNAKLIQQGEKITSTAIHDSGDFGKNTSILSELKATSSVTPKFLSVLSEEESAKDFNDFAALRSKKSKEILKSPVTSSVTVDETSLKTTFNLTHVRNNNNASLTKHDENDKDKINDDILAS